MVHVAVVGAYGSAGVAAADELLEREGEIEDDLELTLIDDGEPGGGLCILRGCMPSKDVLSAGQHRYQARHDDRLEECRTSTPKRSLPARTNTFRASPNTGAGTSTASPNARTSSSSTRRPRSSTTAFSQSTAGGSSPITS